MTELTNSEMGKIGGKSTFEKYGTKHFIKISKKGKEKRLANKLLRKSALNKSLDKYLENATDIMK